MRRLSAVICLFVMLSFTACDSGTQEMVAPKSIDDLKIEVKDSRIRAGLSETFQIDAEVTGDDISKISSYKVFSPKMSTDKIAGIFMPDGGYEIKDLEDGSVEYTKGKEKLVVQTKEKSDSPQITYCLNTDKEYRGIVGMYNGSKGSTGDTANTEAGRLIKEKLDQLNIEYCDLSLYQMNYALMNEEYANSVKYERSSPALFEYTNSVPLDEHFKFMPGDDCYVINGNLMLKGLPVYDFMVSNQLVWNIYAAVSSRGIEYLKIDPFYSADDANHEIPVLSVEKAVMAFCRAYNNNDEAKKKLDISVNKICLSYQFDNVGVTDDQRGYIDPIWSICYTLRPLGGKDTDINYKVCKIDASDGSFTDCSEESLFTYLDFNNLQED